MKSNEQVMGMDTTSTHLKEALRQKNERINALFLKGMAGLPSDGLRQRVIENTGPVAGYDSANGGAIVQTGKSLVRGATSEGIYAASEGLANFAKNLGTKTVPEVINFLEELRDMRNGLTPQEIEKRKADRAAKYAVRSKDLEREPVQRAITEYADTTDLIRRNIRSALEIDQQFAASKTGQIAQGFGQMAGVVAAGTTGPLGVLATSVGQIYDEAYQDAKDNSQDDATAHRTALKYLPAASLDYLSDNLIVGKILKPLKGKMRVKDLLKDIAVTSVAEGATEGAQQLYLNQIAKKLEGYDPNRKFDQEVYDSVLVGAVVGGGVTTIGAGVHKLSEKHNPSASEGKSPGAAEAIQQITDLPDGGKSDDGKIYPTAEAAAAGDQGSTKEATDDEPVPADPELLRELRSEVAEQPPGSGEQSIPVTQPASPETLEGDKIDHEWTAFSEESGSLGIPRTEMPQIKAEARGALTQFLKARGVQHTEEEVLPSALKPTQAEYSQAKVDKARGFEGGDRAILVSSDNHVVDGHHQWIGKLTDTPNEPMRVIRLDAPIKELLPKIAEFPSVKAAAGATSAKQPTSRPKVPVSETPRQSIADKRTELLAKIDEALTVAPEKAGVESETVTIESGSSKFTVRNSKEVLQRLRRQVQRKIPGNEIPGRDDGRPRDQGAVVKDYQAAKTEAVKRYALDQMTPATLKKLGLTEKYERVAPGMTLTREAAQALRDLKAGKREKFTVTASAGSAETEIDPTAPASLAFVDANEGDYPPGLVQQVHEFATVLNAERRGRGEAEIAFTPQKPGPAASDRGSRLPGDEGIGPGGGNEPSIRFVRGIERALGKRVVFVRSSVPVAWHAMTSPNRANTILVNVDADSPVSALIGHELAHNVKAQNPEVYRRMREIIYAATPIYSLEYVRSLGLTGADATELAANLTERTKGIVAEARRKALAKLAKKHSSTKVTRQVVTAVMRAGLLNNLGALEVTDIRDAVAKELKLPRITAEQAAKLANLSDAVRTAGNDMARGRAELKLLEEMRLYRGVRPVDLLTGVWYANALSSPTTHAANFGPGNAVGGLIQVGSMVAADPRRAPQAVLGYLHGLGMGWADAKSIVAKGEGLRDFGDKFGLAGRTLEIADARRDLPGWVPGKGLIQLNVRLLRYVGRLMRAADSVFFHAAQDAYLQATTAKLLASEYSGPELPRRIREVLQIAPDVWINARQQAVAEGWHGTDLSLRIASLVQQHRAGAIANAVGAQAKDLTSGAKLFAEQATINQTPEGLAGIVYQGLSHVASGVRVRGVPVLRPFLMFLRIPTNLFNNSLNMTPVGALRAWNGSMVTEVRLSAEEGEATFVRRSMADDERARLFAQSVIGSTIMAAVAAAALSGNDDDGERWFDVTAKGPDDYRKRHQLEATGWRPYSLRFGDRWISYKDSVLLIPLALVGAYVDASRYSGADDATLAGRLTAAAAKAPRAIFETSMLQGLGELLDAMRGESSAERLEGFMARLAVTAQPYVPGSAFLGAIDRTFFPEQRESDAPGGALTAAAPFVRNLGSQRMDVLGQPVRRSPWDRFSSPETNDPLRELLRDKGVFISVPSRETKLGNDTMDEDTYRDYLRMSGERIRRRLGPLVPTLRGQSKEAVEKTVDAITRQEREVVKNILRVRRRQVYNPFSVAR